MISYCLVVFYVPFLPISCHESNALLSNELLLIYIKQLFIYFFCCGSRTNEIEQYFIPKENRTKRQIENVARRLDVSDKG
jgi:hypothetical protein